MSKARLRRVGSPEACPTCAITRTEWIASGDTRSSGNWDAGPWVWCTTPSTRISAARWPSRPSHLGTVRKPEEQERMRERLFREARSAGILSHPGIVTIYDVEQQGDLAYIAMEYVDGPTLDQLLSEVDRPSPGADLQHSGADRRGARLRPPEGHRAPRHQAGQHHDRGRRHGQDHRFRNCQDHRLRAVHDDRLDRRHAALHVARAGAGADRGRPLRPVLAGGDRLRDADRREAVHRRAPHHGGLQDRGRRAGRCRTASTPA